MHLILSLLVSNDTPINLPVVASTRGHAGSDGLGRREVCWEMAREITNMIAIIRRIDRELMSSLCVGSKKLFELLHVSHIKV